MLCSSTPVLQRRSLTVSGWRSTTWHISTVTRGLPWPKTSMSMKSLHVEQTSRHCRTCRQQSGDWVQSRKSMQTIRWRRANLWQWKVSKDIGEELCESAAHVEEHRQACSRSHLFQFGLPAVKNICLQWKIFACDEKYLPVMRNICLGCPGCEIIELNYSS